MITAASPTNWYKSSRSSNSAAAQVLSRRWVERDAATVSGVKRTTLPRRAPTTDTIPYAGLPDKSHEYVSRMTAIEDVEGQGWVALCLSHPCCDQRSIEVHVGPGSAMKRRSTSWPRSSIDLLEAANATGGDDRRSARHNARRRYILRPFGGIYLFPFSLDARSAYFSCEVSANAVSRVEGVSSYGTGSANWLTVRSHFRPSIRL